MPIRSIGSVDVVSVSSSESKEEENEEGGTHRKLVKAAQLGKAKSIVMTGSLGSFGSNLYH